VARIYISSTFADLKDYREAVYRSLRRMKHDVVAMEDYVAADERPLDRCLEDVSQCDVYVGIFAHRYGFVPPEGNPDGRSITELEMRKAVEAKKERLLFFIDPEHPWRPGFIEAGEGAERLGRLRNELTLERLASFFAGPDDLAAKVVAAVHLWGEKRRPAPAPTAPAAPASAPRHAREITHHAYLAYTAVDEPFVLELARQWTAAPFSRSCLLSSRALYAEQAIDLETVEKGVRQCHTAVVVLSEAALGKMRGQEEPVRRVLDLLQERTGHVLALCRSRGSAEQAAEWNLSTVFDGSDLAASAEMPSLGLVTELDSTLAPFLPTSRMGIGGLPFVVVAMVAEEAAELSRPESLLAQKLGTDALQQFQELTASLVSQGAPPFLERYGAKREMWRPFASSGRTIAEDIAEVVRGLNEQRAPQLRGRIIKPQYYSFEALVRRDPALRVLYREIAETGCVVLLDELSMFHPTVYTAFHDSPLFGSEQAAVVTISPFDPYRAAPSQILERELSRRLAAAFDRFALDCDPLCEIGVGNEHRLKRWLHHGLPRALHTLREPRPNRRILAEFAQSVGQEGSSEIAGLLYSEDGLL
jgi:hypothetical protein